MRECGSLAGGARGGAARRSGGEGGAVAEGGSEAGAALASGTKVAYERHHEGAGPDAGRHPLRAHSSVGRAADS